MEIINFHDPELSLLQSAIRHTVCHGRRDQAGLAAEHPVMCSAVAELEAIHTGTRVESLTLPTFADACGGLLVRYGWARLRGDEEEQKRISSLFRKSICDPGWLTLIEDYIDTYIVELQRPVYRDAEDGHRLIFDLPQTSGELKVGILGDWGTGEAPALALLDELFRQRPDVIIHLGDIYYGGSRDEVRQNFLDPIVAARRRHDLPVPVYNLPGNHDYYTGGAGFYEVLDELNAGQPQGPQGASFFSLRNEHWQLQGMDTGFFDYDLARRENNITRLHDSEARWHRQQIAEAAEAGRRVILFSHHQLFSALQDIGGDDNRDGRNVNPHLLEVFGEALEAGQIAAWFWGHEHRLQVYGPYLNLPVGRGVGHSAIPRLDDGYRILHSQVPLNSEIQLGRRTQDFLDRGYVLLTLNGRQAQARYDTMPADASLLERTERLELYSETL